MTERKLTVQETSNRYGVHPGSEGSRPAILLKGKWLNDAGFPSRSCVSVEVNQGHITITPLPQPRG
jgi:hypothetical protein